MAAETFQEKLAALQVVAGEQEKRLAECQELHRSNEKLTVKVETLTREIMAAEKALNRASAPFADSLEKRIDAYVAKISSMKSDLRDHRDAVALVWEAIKGVMKNGDKK